MNNYAIKTITAAQNEPIDKTEAKLHMAIDDTTFDDLIEEYIKAARQYVEAETHRQLVTATYELIADRFAGSNNRIYLPFGQLQSVTSVKYIDTDGVEQTLDSSKYKVSDSREPGFIEPAYSESWPTARLEADAVRIRFVCGYGAPNTVPGEVKHVLLMLVAHFFEHREAVAMNASAQVVPMGVPTLLKQFNLGDEFTWYEPAN